ncbi:MAG: substrate-binding domain-containing protein [Candidatus Bathyarchaeia archaeon]
MREKTSNKGGKIPGHYTAYAVCKAYMALVMFGNAQRQGMSSRLLSQRVARGAKALLLVLAIVASAATAGAYCYLRSTTEENLIVSTTTSLYETGFLDVLKERFEARNPGFNVSFLSQGTGLAIQTAMRGDVDLILVHDAARELSFLQDGYGVNRKVVAYNFFAIVGPTEDSAGIRGLSPIEALRKIYASAQQGGVVWVSRGDDSGTHMKEKQLWQQAGINHTAIRTKSWYLEAGSGMTAALKLADEKRGYTLTDMGTYLMSFRNRNIDLDVLVSAGKELLNVYSVIVCNPRKANLSRVRFEGAMRFTAFLVSEEGQSLFASFGVEQYGQPLFNPYVKLLKEGTDPVKLQWIQDLAYFNGTECPASYRYKAGDLYRP